MSVSDRIAVVAALEGLNSSGRGLRVEFLRQSDRYAHRILAVGCEEMPVLLLESVEATDREEYPSSPVLQALNVDNLVGEDVAEECAAMLLGMSGKGHWSLTVKATEPGSGGVIFDAACRVKKIPETLGSCYLWGQRVQVSDPDRIPRLHFGSGICLVEPMGPWLLDPYIRTIMFSAVSDPLHDRPPVTLRWRYRMAVSEA